MSYAVIISATERTPHEGAATSLTDSKGNSSELYCDFTTLLRSVREPSEDTQDFLLVAAAVYSLDKIVPRSQTNDGWSRTFEVTIPVAEPAMWNGISKIVNACLSFLSGDTWEVHFTKRASPLILRRQRKRKSRIQQRFASGKVTCLFSGGLDSLIGAIDWLEENPQESLALVGHHDPGIGGPLSDQEALLKGLLRSYQGRIHSTFAGVGHLGRGLEITMRSRSLLFVALGLIVAEQLGRGSSLLIPENGTIALNVPLTPSRRGSCSTRTAHPHYLELLRLWLTGIGLDHPIENPLLSKTKGMAILECRNRPLLESVFRHSVSCAKRGHTSTWINKQANGCGRCMPCIYRRAALHAAGLDDEVYGVDICKGEVDWNNPDSEAADDFRTCLSFLLRNPLQIDIAKMLMANGQLPPLDAITHAETVQRAMDEIRALLADKGTLGVRNASGVGGRTRHAN